MRVTLKDNTVESMGAPVIRENQQIAIPFKKDIMKVSLLELPAGFDSWKNALMVSSAPSNLERIYLIIVVPPPIFSQNVIISI